MILNLGCGNERIENALNVDIDNTTLADIYIDLDVFPWRWRNNSIEGIYMIHSLEHLAELDTALDECYRILKPKGFLCIHVPHSSCAGANGCLYHTRTFSYNSLKDYLEDMFKTVHQRIIWLPHYECQPIQWLIDASPRFFERI